MSKQVLTSLSELDHILELSTNLFMRLGIKSVSMDDISSELGISKKTLYKHFENKKDLVTKSISRHIEQEEKLISEISRIANDAIDEMAQIAEYTVIHFREIRPTLIHDLQKYYRDIWEKMTTLNSVYIKKRIEDNILRGISEGYYRLNADADIVAKLYVAKSFSLVDEGLFSLNSYQRDHLIKQHILYHMHGILSDQGLQHIKDFQLFKD